VWPLKNRLDMSSFRVRIPLLMMVTIIIATLATTSVLTLRSYAESREESAVFADAQARAVAVNLLPAYLEDDVWLAYEIAGLAASRLGQEVQPQVIALDRRGLVFAATDPLRFKLGTPLSQAGGEWRNVGDWLATQGALMPVPPDISPFLLAAMPVMSEDGDILGRVIVAAPQAIYWERFARHLAPILLATLAILGMLLPIGWYLGNRISTPLVRMATRMAQVGREIPDAEQLQRELPDSDDELGRLSLQFRKMIMELQEKHALERSMISSERLAAVGRLTAGIAHEINNPLGGMLNALNTHKKLGITDARTEKTLSLLERGLLQIRQTVSALLVEAKIDKRMLGPQDIDDVLTLLAPQLAAKQIKPDWYSNLLSDVNLPAAPVRQVLINLLLNAVKAASLRGEVSCHVEAIGPALYITVCNDGATLPLLLERLFEPFRDNESTGLGLWITYQIVRQLGGQISAFSDGGITQFDLTIPFGASL